MRVVVHVGSGGQTPQYKAGQLLFDFACSSNVHPQHASGRNMRAEGVNVVQRKFEKQVLGGAHCADLQASEACVETGQLCSLVGVATT